MLFNSIDFAIFLPIVFLLYWFVFKGKLRVQNMFLVVSSYFFYGLWDWRFLFLILFSTIIDYTIGKAINANINRGQRKLLLSLSLIINLGLLGFFKYYNFFLDSFVDTFSFFGTSFTVNRLDIILPVGISFYTFQTLSYTIDIYRGKLKPVNDFIAFASFVSFFPQLVAGPIERATNLLPQFFKKRTFNYTKSVDGLQQILWGLFKKIVIADNAAVFVNDIFANYQDYNGSTLAIGAVFFAFQIYGDFSGYSDIAIGTARLFGFNLMQNFAFPYFSRDIAEFWRRWHISLSTWFRDYLYIPLGGSKGGLKLKVRNVFIIFLVSGFWHGANWTFIFWGFLNALFFLPLLLSKRNRNNLDVVASNRLLPNFRESITMLTTFLLTCFAWIFFRADSIAHAFNYLQRMCSKSLFNSPVKDIWTINTAYQIIYLVILMLFFVVLEWLHRDKQYGLQINIKSKTLRWLLFYFIILACFLMNGIKQEFIYFQF